MKKFKRIFVIVMDSFGAGHAKDGAAYGDDGADTMGHIAEKHDNWKIPNLTRLGLANLHPLKGVTPAEHPLGYQLVLNEKSCGKDTMTGHWEMIQKLFYTIFTNLIHNISTMIFCFSCNIFN